MIDFSKYHKERTKEKKKNEIWGWNAIKTDQNEVEKRNPGPKLKILWPWRIPELVAHKMASAAHPTAQMWVGAVAHMRGDARSDVNKVRSGIKNAPRGAPREVTRGAPTKFAYK